MLYSNIKETKMECSAFFFFFFFFLGGGGGGTHRIHVKMKCTREMCIGGVSSAAGTGPSVDAHGIFYENCHYGIKCHTINV